MDYNRFGEGLQRPVRLAMACVVAVAVTAVACEPGASRTQPLALGPELPAYEVVETFRLGGEDAPEFGMFQLEPEVVVDRSGRMFVLHPYQGRVAVLDSLGEFVHWIGRRGAGPGEFEIAAKIGLLGDTLWVRNLPSPRISMFLDDGSHVSTVRTPSFDFGYPLTMPPSVSGYLRGGKAWIEAEGSVVDAERPVELPLVVGDRELREADSLFTIANPRGRLAGQAFAPFPVPPFYHVAADGSAIVVADWSDAEPGKVQIEFHAMGSGEGGSWALDFAERPVPPHVRDSVIAGGVQAVHDLAERLRAQGIPEGSFRTSMSRAEVEESVFLPAHYPPLRQVRMGLDSTLWIQLMNDLNAGAWVAFDLEGKPIFQVTLPDGITVQQASATTVWGTGRDELDVPFLVRFDIAR